MLTRDARAPNREAFSSPVLAATIASAAMVAQQVIGKATRDALFLSHFPVARLPIVLIIGSLMSAVVVWLTTHWIARFGPARVSRVAFAVHGVVVLVEWALASRIEPQIALVFYVQTIAVGGTLVSAFWSVVSEGFDPHTAKQVVGRIGAGAALGGIIGGAIAWGASKVTTVPTMLGVMAALSGVCTWGVAALARGTRSAALPPTQPTAQASGLSVLRQTPYLRLLALIVLLGAIVQALLDYVLGAKASETYGGGASLLAFFAIFQTAIGTVSFLVQLSANRLALGRLGVGGTLALLPGAVVAFGALVLGAPSLATVALQRGAEAVLRGSLFRSAYEVLYTPVTQALKRPTKLLIDVSFDRIGLMAGSALTLGLVAVFPHQAALHAVVALAVLAAALQLFVAYGLNRGYIAELTNRLRTGTLLLDAANIVDATTRETLSRTMASLDRPTLLRQIAAFQARGETRDVASEPMPEYPELETSAADDVVGALVDLRSPDAAVIVRGLRRDSTELLPLVLPMLWLLGRDDVAREAARALAPLVPRIVGSITDVIMDTNRPTATRRRAARLLGAVWSTRAAAALDSALDADELDVRYWCGRVLLGMCEKNAELRFDASAAFARARRELASDARDGQRGARELEHAFNVLSLALPREPMQLAYGAVLGAAPFLRGVALEYLDTVLPTDLHEALTSRLEKATTYDFAVRPSNANALEQLLRSSETIQLNLAELRRARDPDGDAQP